LAAFRIGFLKRRSYFSELSGVKSHPQRRPPKQDINPEKMIAQFIFLPGTRLMANEREGRNVGYTPVSRGFFSHPPCIVQHGTHVIEMTE
jgi:hypothetical protein